jgi:hypothetical protein
MSPVTGSSLRPGKARPKTVRDLGRAAMSRRSTTESLLRFDTGMKTSTVITSVAMMFLTSTFVGLDLATADTLARSFPLSNQVMITVYKPRFGSDTDGKTLFDAMNVPVQGSVLGPGKSIENSTRSFSWVCGDRGADGFQCTIMIQKGAGTEIHSNPIAAKYEVFGSDAAALFQLIHPNTLASDFAFKNAEGTLMLEAKPNHFLMTFEE